MAEEVERIFVIPLRKRNFKSSKAAPTAIKRVKDYIKRHMKVEEKNVWIDSSLNEAIWSFGMYKMPRKIRVKAVKFEDGVVEAYLPELEFKKSIRELLKEERAKKEPILRKEEAKEAEEAPPAAPGAEGYEIAPTGEGEVKIKKKKAPKKKAEKKEPVEEVPSKEKEEKEVVKEEKEKKPEKKSEESGPKKPKKTRKKKSEH